MNTQVQLGMPHDQLSGVRGTTGTVYRGVGVRGGGPAMPNRTATVTIHGRDYRLEDGEQLIVGRNAEPGVIPLGDPAVSNPAALLRYDGGIVWVRSLSRNAIFIWVDGKESKLSKTEPPFPLNRSARLMFGRRGNPVVVIVQVPLVPPHDDRLINAQGEIHTTVPPYPTPEQRPAVAAVYARYIVAAMDPAAQLPKPLKAEDAAVMLGPGTTKKSVENRVGRYIGKLVEEGWVPVQGDHRGVLIGPFLIDYGILTERDLNPNWKIPNAA